MLPGKQSCMVLLWVISTKGSDHVTGKERGNDCFFQGS